MPVHKKIERWFVDSGYILRGVAATVLYRKPPKHYLGHAVKGRAPVMLVPGILETWGSMKNIGDQLSRAGHPVYIVPSLGYNVRSIPASAKQICAVLERDDLRGAVLVAHSKGGLIGKYLLAHHNADHRVLGMVAVAAPFSGSAMARLVPNRSFRELMVGSEIVRDLAQHAGVNRSIISIIPAYDRYVRAAQGSFLEGAHDNIKVPVGGHVRVLFSKKVVAQVLRAVEQIAAWPQ